MYMLAGFLAHNSHMAGAWAANHPLYRIMWGFGHTHGQRCWFQMPCCIEMITC